MTELISINEAVEQRVPMLRRDPWVPRGRITLHLVGDTGVGPWVTVEDGASDVGVIDPQQVLLFSFDLDEKTWEPWSKE